MPISHGSLFVALELVIIMGLLWGDRWWRARLMAAGRDATWRLPAAETMLMALVYASLRVQPYLRGGDVFAFVLGVFDGVALMAPMVFFAVNGAYRASARVA